MLFYYTLILIFLNIILFNLIILFYLNINVLFYFCRSMSTSKYK